MNIWDKLIYLQIKTHLALREFTCLPRGKLAKELLKGMDEEARKKYKQSEF